MGARERTTAPTPRERAAGTPRGRATSSVSAALARLARRKDVALVRRAALEAGVEVRVVGGAVRDAFLGLPAGDLDLAAPRAGAGAVASALAASAGGRVVAIGAPPRRILHVAGRDAAFDVWEVEGDGEADLLRRDFTVNALAVAYPSGRLEALPGALDDLARRRLSLPRRGVLLEDPVRVLRAARFEATLPGFRLDPAALAELAEAASRLPATPPERRRAEIERLLAAPRPDALRALARLERHGVLARLLPGTTARQRRTGLRLVARADRGASPGVLLALLAAPAGPERALAFLAELRLPRALLRLADAVLSGRCGRADARSGVRPGAAGAGRRGVTDLLRSLPAPVREALDLLELLARGPDRAVVARARRIAERPRALARVLSPGRPLSPADVAALLDVAGPRLGAALGELDAALAARQVRSARGARRHLLAWAGRARAVR